MEFNFTVSGKTVASIKLKYQQLFIQKIKRRTIKINYRKAFMPYGIMWMHLQKNLLCTKSIALAFQLAVSITIVENSAALQVKMILPN